MRQMMDKSTERRFSEEQYQMLLRCSEKRDMTEWNDWRKENPDIEIQLEGADLTRAHLARADLVESHLEHAELFGAHLEYAALIRAHLEHASLSGAYLEHAYLAEAHLENTDVLGASLEHANLLGAHLENANLNRAYLKDARLNKAHLQYASLPGVCLESAVFEKTHLEGTSFDLALVDGNTLITECIIDDKTDFRGVGLDSIRIDSNIKGLLQYNVRRLNWEDWYKEHKFLKHPVKRFFEVSDYGISTARIILFFFGFTIFFSALYEFFGVFSFPGIVNNLFDTYRGMPSYLTIIVRPLYFSIVTMTTLGFGDMSAAPNSLLGHVLLSIQVIIGYVLLGALITRLGILFTSDGPIDKKKFTKNSKIEKEQ